MGPTKNTHLKNLDSRQAFTLVELMMASAILAFAISGLLTLFGNTLALNEINRNQFIALMHGELVMEEIKSTPFSSVNASIQNGTWNWSSSVISSKGLVPLDGEQINASVAGTTVLNVTVETYWLDRGSRPRNLSLMTKLVTP
jgi:prepilin-type N-terminal cleavage/methylation domain-containing protein